MASSKSNERKTALKAKLQHAIRQFGRVCTKSNHSVPKEYQISLDVDNKMVFNYKTQQFIRNPAAFKCDYYTKELCDENFRVSEPHDTVMKYFNQIEQEEHTLLRKPDDNNDLRLFNKDGSLYDTTDETVYRKSGLSIYALSLDDELVACAEVKRGAGVEFFYAHSTLLNNRPCLCSGKIRVEGGKIKYISNDSGHYKPTGENLYVAIKKLEGLFAEDATMSIYFLQVVEDSDEQQPEVDFGCHCCSVDEFLKKVESAEPIIPGYLMVDPFVYFKRLRDWEENYKNQWNSNTYKPVAVCGNATIAAEHCVRTFLKAGFGFKPRIVFDSSTGKVMVSFCRKSDAVLFYCLLMDHESEIRSSLLKNTRHYVCTYENNDRFIVYSSQEVVYSFVNRILKMSVEDVMLLKGELEVKSGIGDVKNGLSS